MLLGMDFPVSAGASPKHLLRPVSKRARGEGGCPGGVTEYGRHGRGRPSVPCSGFSLAPISKSVVIDRRGGPSLARLPSLSYPPRAESEMVALFGPGRLGLRQNGRRGNVKYMVTFHIRAESDHPVSCS